MSKKFIISVTILVIILGNINFWMWAMYDNVSGLMFYKFPHKLEPDQCVVKVLNNDDILIGDMSTGKLQVYDGDGKFKYGIAIPDGKEGYTFLEHDSSILIQMPETYYVVKDYKNYIKYEGNADLKISEFAPKDEYELNHHTLVDSESGKVIHLSPMHIFPISIPLSFLVMFISLIILLCIKKEFRELVFRKNI